MSKASSLGVSVKYKTAGLPKRPFGPIDYLVLAIIALVCAVLLGGLVLMLGYKSTLTGERDALDKPFRVTLENSYLGLIPVSTSELPGVKEAIVQSADELKRSKGNLIKTYRIKFVTDAGITPLTFFMYTGQADHEAFRDQFNAALHDKTSKSFTLERYHGGWWAILSVALLLLVPVSLALWIARRATQSLAFWPEDEVLKVE
ncbi:MAG TPA: hypothetical protein VGE52_20310 [Pirellulales bacterium]